MKKPYRFWVRNGVYYVQYRDAPGKWVSLNTRDQDEADRLAWDACSERIASEGISLGAFAKNFFLPGACRWIARMESHGKTYRGPSLEKKRAILENYIMPRFGGVNIQDITRRQVSDWLQTVKSVQSRKLLQADAKNKILAALRQIMDEAVFRDYLERDPTVGIPPYRDLETKKRDVFTVDELHAMFPADFDRLLDIWLSWDWAAYFFLQASTGLRPGEVGGLRWSDWLRTRKGLVVSRAVENTTGLIKETKTKIVKPVPLTERAGQMLLMLEATRGGAHDDLIFRATRGGPVQLSTAQKHLEASMGRAGVEPAGRTPYTFRHSFDTHAMRVLDSKTVQELMGHKTVKMTMEQYYNPTDEERIQALPEGAWKGMESMWRSD